MSLRRALARFAAIGVIGALLIGVVVSGVWRHISLEDLQTRQAAVSALVARHPALSLLAFLGADTLLVATSLPGSGLMSLAAGLFFGPVIGGGAALAATTLGSLIMVGAVRTAIGDWAIRRAGPTVRRAAETLAANGFFSILALRLMPVMPLMATNLAAAIARVPIGQFAAASLLGAAPAIFLLAAAGAGLGGGLARGADAGLLMQPRFLAPLAILALLSAAPILWRALIAPRRPAK